MTTMHTLSFRRDDYVGPHTLRVESDGVAVDITVGLIDGDGDPATRVDSTPLDGKIGEAPQSRTWKAASRSAALAPVTGAGVFTGEAAGKTLEELRARFRFQVIHEEDPQDERSCVRVLRFANLTRAIEFAGLFDPGHRDDVWFTFPYEVSALFGQPVCLSVTFFRAERPAIVRDLKSTD